MTVRHISDVIPAKAGIHNHLIFVKATASRMTEIEYGVWVPAFAGTTNLLAER